MLGQFMKDLVKGNEVSSRKNKKDIIEYVRKLTALAEVTNTRIDSEPLSIQITQVKSGQQPTPRKPQRAKKVHYEDEIARTLKVLGNEKLESLYYSICFFELEKHSPIIAIGIWAFFETITGLRGRKDGNSFDSFLNNDRLSSYGIVGEDRRAVRSVLQRITEYGNQTKHHKVSAAFNGDQINNDMNTLKGLILSLIENKTKQS